MIEVPHPHQFVVHTIKHYKNQNKQLHPGIQHTLNSMITGIYEDLDGINDVHIEMMIYDTDNISPSTFSCKFKDGKSLMVITITFDGEKTIRFERLTWWLRCSRFFSSSAFRKSIAKPTICAVIGGALGFLVAGPAGAVMGVGVGLIAGKKVVDTAIAYLDRDRIQN